MPNRRHIECPTCHREIKRHWEHGGVVHIEPTDPRDPFCLLDPQPVPFTDDEASAAIRSLDELESDGQLERWEATRRAQEAEIHRLQMLHDGACDEIAEIERRLQAEREAEVMSLEARLSRAQLAAASANGDAARMAERIAELEQAQSERDDALNSAKSGGDPE